MRTLTAVMLLLALGASGAHAQGAGFQFGYLWTDPPGITYRLGWTSRLTGPFGAEIHGVHVNSSGPLGNLWGGGVDLSLFRSGTPGLYLVGGFEGGYNAAGSETFRGSWSAGLGYEFFPLRGLSLSLEGRYRVVGPGSYDGIELGTRLGLDRRSRRSSGSSRSSGSAATSAPPTRESVNASLATAGTAPATSSRIAGVDQARQGTPVPRDVGSLRPGDILTFAEDGSRVSHVGLYVGTRRFIHSASSGVQLSLLSDDDVSGRWWYRRWVGARRILD
jgi:hypothetical protein